MHLAILGPIAVGKTSVGTRVAHRLGLPWRDSDEQIEAAHGRTSRVIADRRGVDGLHELELDMLRAALDGDPVVVAPAASVVDSEHGRRMLAGDDVWCVLLEADVDTIVGRVRDDDHRRPITPQELQRLIAGRADAWRQLAAVRYATDASSPEAIARDIVERFPGP